MDLSDLMGYAGVGSSVNWVSILGVIVVLVALAAAALFAFVWKDEKAGLLGKVQKVFAFKGLFLDKLLTFVFTYSVVYYVLMGIVNIIDGAPVYGCLEMMILEPLKLRIALEVAKLLKIGVQNLMEINAKMKNEGDAPAPSLDFEAAEEPAEEPAPAADVYCGNCGNKVEPGNAFCPNCGKSVQ